MVREYKKAADTYENPILMRLSEFGWGTACAILKKGTKVSRFRKTEPISDFLAG